MTIRNIVDKVMALGWCKGGCDSEDHAPKALVARPRSGHGYRGFRSFGAYFGRSLGFGAKAEGSDIGADRYIRTGAARYMTVHPP